MTGTRAVEIVRTKLAAAGGRVSIPLLRASKDRTEFTAQLRDDGIDVDNLPLQPFLPWSVFEATVDLLSKQGGRALKGSAQGGKLGSKELPLHSVEGHVASVAYGQQLGDSVFRRSTPIANVLVWAGVCRHGLNELQLVEEREDID